MKGIGIAVLPDYLAKDYPGLINLLEDMEMPVFDAFFICGGLEGYEAR